jgi:hypothetical protein
LIEGLGVVASPILASSRELGVTVVENLGCGIFWVVRDEFKLLPVFNVNKIL